MLENNGEYSIKTRAVSGTSNKRLLGIMPEHKKWKREIQLLVKNYRDTCGRD